MKYFRVHLESGAVFHFTEKELIRARNRFFKAELGITNEVCCRDTFPGNLENWDIKVVSK